MATRGFGRGGERGGDRNAPNKRQGKGGPPTEQWYPKTKLGRMVQSDLITNLDQIFKFSLPIKEPEIVSYFLKDGLKEEVMQVKPVQKQTCAGQRTRFKVFVIIGDENGHIGLGSKVHKEVQGAIKGALLDAKMNVIPVRAGYWGNKIGAPHTVPCKVSGKGGSVRVRLIPAPRGTGIVGAPVPKKVI
jgi:small subunit ribosomal protein S2e